MITPRCFACWKELEELGGILLSNPIENTSSDNVDTIHKFHLCVGCFPYILDFIMGKESLNYQKGMPTLQNFIKRMKQASQTSRSDSK